jgi:regulator of replication initiation timing
MTQTIGWDETHDHKIEIEDLKKKIYELQEENFLLRTKNRRLSKTSK